jgi:hypothetical protein
MDISGLLEGFWEKRDQRMRCTLQPITQIHFFTRCARPPDAQPKARKTVGQGKPTLTAFAQAFSHIRPTP